MQVGGLLGESNSNSMLEFSYFLTVHFWKLQFSLDNTTKIFYGLLKEPELNMPEDNEDSVADGEEGVEKPKVF